MHLHEYQTKDVLKRYGIPVPEFWVVKNLDEARQLIKSKCLTSAVVKVQVHAGGRGKAGGVKIAKTPEEILDAVQHLLGKKIVNAQTGPEGIVARQVLISPLVNIKKEYYLAATIDRDRKEAIFITSAEGGMEIEELALTHPEKIKIENISSSDSVGKIIVFMGWKGKMAEEGEKILNGIAEAFEDTDAMLLEINPLVETSEGHLIALDAKLSLDENAFFRQQEFASQYDASQLSRYEAKAKEHELAYVALDGEIGCMVNGAGLAMATMDIIYHYGGNPANFLDVGGGASEEKIAEGFKIILSDPKVKSVLINIFGGIMNCETLAKGIVSATQQQKVNVPLVVRMEGTNVEKGRKILEDANLDIILADTLSDAAKKAVKAAKRS